MPPELLVALLTGSFAIAGGLGGVLLSDRLNRRSTRERLLAEDQRRWLIDRRTAYSNFLATAHGLLREADAVHCQIPLAGTLHAEEEAQVQADLERCTSRIAELMPATLGEVELLASPAIVDMASRVSSALWV